MKKYKLPIKKNIDKLPIEKGGPGSSRRKGSRLDVGMPLVNVNGKPGEIVGGNSRHGYWVRFHGSGEEKRYPAKKIHVMRD